MKIHHLFWGICLCFSTNILFAQNYQKTSSGIKTTVNAVDIEVQFFAPAVARIIKSPEGVAYEKESLSVIAKPEKVSFKAPKSNPNLPSDKRLSTNNPNSRPVRENVRSINECSPKASP